MLRRMQLDPCVYTHRTYVVSSGDNFSAAKAVEFEQRLPSRKQVPTEQRKSRARDDSTDDRDPLDCYDIVTVPRARRVHQSYLTAPFSTLQCLWACLLVLRGSHPDQNSLLRMSSPYPDVILANGPATAVCVVLAARILRLLHCLVTFLSFGNFAAASDGSKLKSEGKDAPSDFQLRTIFVESWARVTTLSLSGKLLLPFVDRFLVQWPGLEGKMAWRGMRKTEYVGALVD
jgi:beta-1,4-N-acetylglucosaminyltransferase